MSMLGRELEQWAFEREKVLAQLDPRRARSAREVSWRIRSTLSRLGAAPPYSNMRETLRAELDELAVQAVHILETKHAPPPKPAPPPRAHAEAEPLRVCVVGEDVMTAELLRQALEDGAIVTVQTGWADKRPLKVLPPHAVVVDGEAVPDLPSLLHRVSSSAPRAFRAVVGVTAPTTAWPLVTAGWAHAYLPLVENIEGLLATVRSGVIARAALAGSL